MKLDKTADFLPALVYLLLLAAPLAIAGLCLINTGLNRVRSASHSLFASLTLVSLAMLVFFALGFGVQGWSGRFTDVIPFRSAWGYWIGSGPFFLHGIDLSLGSQAAITFIWSSFCVAIAALIPLGASAERWRLAAACAWTAVLAGFVYPQFAHEVLGGWLGDLAIHLGLPVKMADAAGASYIHVAGGLTALAVCWILGPRRGKFTHEGMPTAMPGHNAVIVSFGCFLALAGWFSLNCAGAYLSSGAHEVQFALVIINTMFCACGAELAAVALTRFRFGRPDASLCANGWICGLVASSAVCAYVHPAEAILIGLIAGALVIFSIEIVELRMKVDDPAGAISVHAAGGIWGLLAAGIFGDLASSAQFLVQLAGIATLIGAVLPFVYCLNWLLNLWVRYRVAPEGERQGADLFELGAGAYPEFMTHRDDFIVR